MGLEAATYISGLNASNPVHATDNVSQGDDHLRLIKSTLLASFAGVTGAVTSTHTELNYLDGVTGVTGSGNLALSAAPTFTGLVTAGSFAGSIAADQIDSLTFADARIAESNVTQHQAALSITESQVSDLGTYLSAGDVASTLSIGNADTTLSRDAAGQLAVEGAAVFTHNDAALISGKIHFSTASPTGGAAGDVWFKHAV